MSKNITPYKNSDLGKKEQVTQMFDAISGSYDQLNRVVSFRLDLIWRRKVLAIVAKNKPKLILDIATGTGDLAILMTKIKNSKIIGLDLSPGMLQIGIDKIARKKLSNQIEMMVGDSEMMPFADNHFDAITVSFGIRNFENLEKGLTEILRVLKPSGTFVILETSNPTRFPFKQAYGLYTNFILPVIGKWFSNDGSAYQYLSESAQNFPFGEVLNNKLRKIGFIDVVSEPQFFGAATIYSASKK